MPRPQNQEDFNNRLKLDRLTKARKQKELEDTIRKIVREELKAS